MTQQRQAGVEERFRCPYCGGQIVWDYDFGEVVCSSCGTVVDIIYDCGPQHTSQTPTPHDKTSLRTLRLGEIKNLERRARVSGKKRLGLTIVDRLPSLVRKACEQGIRIAQEISPTLTCGKTLRAKYAVGYIIYSMTTVGRVDTEFLQRTFRLSPTSIRRLVRSVRSKLTREELSVKRLRGR